MTTQTTPLLPESYREWIDDTRHFITIETKLGVSGLARICGYSPSVISTSLAGRYEGDLKAVQARVDGAIDLYRARAIREQRRRYVLTDQSTTIEAAITYALQHKQSAAVFAESGCGKTVTALHMKSREFGIVYVACDSHDFRPGAFLERIATALGVRREGSRCPTWRLQRDISDRLQERQWVLIVDDSHYLLNPNRPGRSAALDTLKDLQSLAETPCVLLGVPQLWDTIERQLDGGWYAQLRGRLGMIQRLSCAQIQPDNVHRVVESMGATCSSAILRSLTELAQRIGGYRNVEKAVLWAKRNGAKEVTTEAMDQYLSFSGNASIATRTQRALPPRMAANSDPAPAASQASAGAISQAV